MMDSPHKAGDGAAEQRDGANGRQRRLKGGSERAGSVGAGSGRAGSVGAGSGIAESAGAVSGSNGSTGAGSGSPGSAGARSRIARIKTAARRNAAAKRGQGMLSGAALKWIAMLTMLIDHIGAAVLQRTAIYNGVTGSAGWYLEIPYKDVLWNAGMVCRIVGRISFPIYCFLLVQGFLHTRDWRKYWARLAVFAIISEIPFDLAVYNIWTGGGQNVFVELAAGLLVLAGLRKAEQMSAARRGPVSLAVLAAGCAVAWILKADYSIDGILIIGVFYVLRRDRFKQALGGGFLAFGSSYGPTYGAAALASVPILLYNGKRGKSRFKYVFYWFYPAHLLLLFLIRRFVIGIPVG